MSQLAVFYVDMQQSAGFNVDMPQAAGFHVHMPQSRLQLVFKEIAEPNIVTICNENGNTYINLTLALQVACLTKHQIQYFSVKHNVKYESVKGGHGRWSNLLMTLKACNVLLHLFDQDQLRVLATGGLRYFLAHHLPVDVHRLPDVVLCQRSV
jgi:hypothetical protein